MPDLITSKIFVDGEKGITASKLNQIMSGAVIQPSFVSGKPASSTLDPTDQLLELKGTGSYATITGQQLIDSVSASVTQNITPTITAVRLRSFNAVGNPSMECDQKLGGQTINVSGSFSGPIIDRWYCSKAGTGAGYCAQLGTGNTVLPGTNFVITTHGLIFNTTTTQASLGATDSLRFTQQIEGSQMRELIGDVHSLQLLVSSTVSPLKFSVGLRDNPTTKSIVYLCTYNAAAGTPQLITIPNIPVWASGGNWSTQPGNLGYILEVTLASGLTYLTSPGAWANGLFVGATGMDNFLANPVNSNFVLRFVQHEPGAQCSTPMDCPFTRNLDDCLRYFCKSYRYAIKPGNASDQNGAPMLRNTRNADSLVLGWLPFAKIMAKTPTVIGYSTTSGTAGTIRDITNGIDRGITTSGWGAGETGFEGFQITGAASALVDYAFHYTADSGW